MSDATPPYPRIAEALRVRPGVVMQQVEDHPPEPPPPPPARDPKAWSTTDIALQAALAGLTAADVLQTVSGILPNYPRYQESNPLLGSHPSKAKVALGATGALLGHTLIANALPDPYRKLWQLGGIGLEADAVRHNHAAGVRINFGKVF